ncbi:hypothetical protein CLU79DRAFT_725950 [Phycomyces nitens]|nr:hypothetical protein CLU79DRAFT_725950 [Phycomyces nitens]
MALLNYTFAVYFLLLATIPRCYAPPIQQENTTEVSEIAILSILRTIILGYLAHVVTIRPGTGVSSFSTNMRRFMCFVFPTGGIAMAFNSFFSAYNADKILGIEKFNIPLQKYDKMYSQSMEYPDYSIGSLDEPLPTHLSSAYNLARSKNTQLAYFLEKTEQRRNWLIRYMETEHGTKIKDYDNAPYLAALLYTMGKSKAEKVKHCILNRHLLIGFDSTAYVRSTKDFLAITEEMTIVGSGSDCQYQSPILPGYIRYLPIDMLDQLRTVHNVDSTSYTEICITIGQLFYTTIECMDVQGDKWAKTIMIIYTAMSILQTCSLIILHKQTMPFSILYDVDVPWGEIINDRSRQNQLEEAKADTLHNDQRTRGISEKYNPQDLFYRGSFLEFILRKRESEYAREEIATDNGSVYIYSLSMIGGIIGSLLICVWADYNSHSTTEWLVLSWIFGSIISFFVFFLYTYSKKYFDSRLIFGLLFILIVLGSLGCVLAATIIGYLPRKDVVL